MIITKEFIETLGCPQADGWITENNLYGVSDTELLEQLKIKNPAFYADAEPLISAKKGINIEYQNAIQIKESGNYSLGKYKILHDGNEFLFETESDKVQKVLEIQNQGLLNSGNKFSVSHVIVQENGDHTWVNVDIYATDYETTFNVFNPLTGQYENCESKLEAQEKFESIKQQLLVMYKPMVKREIISSSGDVSWILENDL
jgi:hypothetical protein